MNREREVTKAGMTNWLEAAQAVDESSASTLDRLLRDNASRQERLKEFGLRGVPTWGPGESLPDVIKQIPAEVREAPGGIFFINCVPKQKSEGIKRERKFGLRWDELLQFAGSLPQGTERYYIEIRQDLKPDYSGTIISDGQGHVVMEWAAGRHSAIEHKSLGDIKKGEINTDMQSGFRYEGGPTENEITTTLGALKKFSPELSRAALEKLNIYSEWSYSKTEGYWFFEAISEAGRAKKFWTKLSHDAVEDGKAND